MPGVDDMRFALIDADGIVTNVIEALEGWTAVEAGETLVPSETASPGDTYTLGTFTTPEPPPAQPTARETYDAATTDAERLEILATHLFGAQPEPV